MKKIFLLLAVAFTNQLAAQNTVVEERSLPPFKRIETSGIVHVILKKGEIALAKIEADEKRISNVKTEVINETLKVFTEGDFNNQQVYNDKELKNIEKIEVTVYYMELKSISASGTSSINNYDTISGYILSVNVSGAGSADLLLNVDGLSTEVTGAGNVKLRGEAGTHNSKVSGAGSLDAFSLNTGTLELETTGAGNAKVNAIENLSIKASGASKVCYEGEAKNKNIQVEGVAGVTPSNYYICTNGTDTTRVVFGRYKVLIIGDKTLKKDTTENEKEKEREYFHWAGIDLGVNGFLTPGNNFNPSAPFSYLEIDYAKSIGLAINFLEKDLTIMKNRLVLGTGLGIDFQSYAFKNNTVLFPNKPAIDGYIDTTINYDKSKLKTTWIQAPLLMQFNTGKTNSKSFHIAAGLIGAYKFSSKAKFKYEKEGDTYKSKVKDDFHLNPFRLSATARAGIGSFNIFATYALNTLFEKDKGPLLYPISFGVTLVGF